MAWWDSVFLTTQKSGNWASLVPHLLANRSWRGMTWQTHCSLVDVTTKLTCCLFFLWFPLTAAQSVTWRRFLWSWEGSHLLSSLVTVTWTRLFAWWDRKTRREVGGAFVLGWEHTGWLYTMIVLKQLRNVSINREAEFHVYCELLWLILLLCYKCDTYWKSMFW